MVQVIDRPPSFGEMIGRGLGQGLSQGIGKGMEFASQLGLEKAKESQKQKKSFALMQASGQFSPEELFSFASAIDKNYANDLFPEVSRAQKLQGSRQLKTPPSFQDNEGEKTAMTSNSQQGAPASSLDDEKKEFVLEQLQKGSGQLHASQRKQRRKEFESDREYEMKLGAGETIKRADEKREELQIKQRALGNFEQALKDHPGGFTLDYIAENLPGRIGEPLRSAKGSQQKSAAKDFLLSNLSRAGNRPNMWIEQQLSSALPDVSKTKEANQTIVEMFKADMDIEKAYLEALGQLQDHYMETQKYVPAKIGREAEQMILPFIKKREEQLSYNLREIFEREQGPKQLKRLLKVPNGTPLTVDKARVILDHFGSEEKAAEEARKLGYTIPGADIYMRQ